MSAQAYVKERAGSKAHVPDPDLPPPVYDWVAEPWPWTVYTACGKVLGACTLVADTVICGTCERRTS